VDHDSKWSFEEYASSALAKHSAKSRVFDGCPANYNAEPEEQTCSRAKKTEDDVHKAEFEQMDRDGDGSVSKEEYMLYTSVDDFRAADRDGDSILTWEEYKAAPKHWRDYDSDRGEQEVRREFNRIDMNRDSQLTREEFEDHQRKLRDWEYLEDAQQEPSDEDVISPEEHWVSFSDPVVHPQPDPGHDLQNVPIYKSRFKEVPIVDAPLVSEIDDDLEIGKEQMQNKADQALQNVKDEMAAAETQEYARVAELTAQNGAEPATSTVQDTTADGVEVAAAPVPREHISRTDTDTFANSDDDREVPMEPQAAYSQ